MGKRKARVEARVKAEHAARTTPVGAADATGRPAAPAVHSEPVPFIPPRPAHTGDPTALPTVFGCVRLLQTAGAQMQVTTVTDAGQPVPLPRWLKHPEHGTSGMQLRTQVAYAVVCTATAGYAAWWADPVGDGWDLNPLRPRRVDCTFDQEWRRVWTLDGRTVNLVFPASTPDWRVAGLLIAPYLVLPEHALPLGPLQAARRAMSGYLDVDAFSANYFQSGRGTSGRYLATEQDLPAETLSRYSTTWMQHQADPMADIPALGGGLKVEDSLLDPATAQWLQSREFNAQEVARMYGVPPRYLGLPSGDASTYATARDNDAALMRFSVATCTDPIATAWTLLMGDTEVQFSAAKMLAMTPLEEHQADAVAIQNGILDVDEVRARRGLGPAPTRPAPAPSRETVDA